MQSQSKNQISGFTLAEVLIAIVILGILSVVFVKMLRGASQQSAQVSRNVGNLEVRNRIGMLLARTDLCGAIFSGLTVDPLSDVALPMTELSVSGNPFVKVGDAIGPGLDISEMNLRIVTSIAATKALEPESVGGAPRRLMTRLFGNFDLKTIKKGNEPALSKDYDLSYPLDILLDDTTNKIAYCSASNSLAALFPFETTCSEFEVMVGIGPEGPICDAIDTGSGGRLAYNQAAPPGAAITTCGLVGENNNVVDKSCKTPIKYKGVQTSSRCIFEGGGWRFITGNNSTTACTEGVTFTDSASEKAVGRFEDLPPGVDLATQDVVCNRSTGVRSFSCETIDKTDAASAKSDAVAGKTSCYKDPTKKVGWSAWVANKNFPTKTGPAAAVCNLGLNILAK